MLHKHHSSIACLVLLLVAAAALESVATRQLDTPQHKKAAQHGSSSTFVQLSYKKALANSSCHGFLIGIGTQKGRVLMAALLAGDISRTQCSSSSQLTQPDCAPCRWHNCFVGLHSRQGPLTFAGVQHKGAGLLGQPACQVRGLQDW